MDSTLPRQSVRVATEADLPFLAHLQRQETNALGFITYEGLRVRVEKRRVFVALENDTPAAFALFDVRGRGATVHQTAAMFDSRRRKLCLTLAELVRENAGLRGAAVIRLACGSDLTPALAFWDAAGFERVGVREGGTHRGRDLILFEAPAKNMTQPDLLTLPRVQRYSVDPHAMSGARMYTRLRRAATRTTIDLPDDPLFAHTIATWDKKDINPE